MRSRHELLARIQQLYELDERMDKVDYLHRLWVADYVAHADTIADCMRELLEGRAVVPEPDGEAAACSLCAA